MPSINFFEEDITFRLKNKNKIKQWIKTTIETEGFKLQELNYIFCSDKYLLQINQQFLKHDTFTDIVTFDLSETSKEVMGEVMRSSPECLTRLSELLAKRKLEGESILKDATQAGDKVAQEHELRASFLRRLRTVFEL